MATVSRPGKGGNQVGIRIHLSWYVSLRRVVLRSAFDSEQRPAPMGGVSSINNTGASHCVNTPKVWRGLDAIFAERKLTAQALLY